jgi:hypothetical protein
MKAYKYTLADSTVVPDSNVFGKIAYMNFIPFLAAKDIPKLIYDTIALYGKLIMSDIKADTNGSTSKYEDLLSCIDMRDPDSNDSGTDGITLPTPSSETERIKKAIYQRMIDSVIVADIGETNIVGDGDYFKELQGQKASGNTYLLACSLKPDSFLAKYATINSSGNLVDISTNPKDLVYLPIEWLTQTYYQIMKKKITTFIDELVRRLVSYDV